MAELYDQYKQVTKKGIIKIKDTCLDIVNDIKISCSSCVATVVATAVSSTFKDNDLKGEYTSQNNSNWYELNLKLVIGSMASRIGLINITQLLSFLDIQNCQSLNGRFFKNIELTIGATLRKNTNE